MKPYIKRSDRNRRRAVNDLDHFARGGIERRGYGAERRAFDRDADLIESYSRRRTLLQLFRQ